MGLSIIKCVYPFLGVALLFVSGCQTVDDRQGYPNQEATIVSFFQHEEFAAYVIRANRREVNEIYGTRFASLRGLGAIILVADTKTPETTLVLKRSSISLELPNGKKLSPLNEDEITEWGVESGISGGEEMLGDYFEYHKREREEGVFKLTIENKRGTVFIFRFPDGSAPLVGPGIMGGKFVVEYVIETPSGKKVPVKGTVLMRIRQ